MTLTLNEILKDSAYKLTQFSAAQIQALENSILVKEVRNKATPYVTCLARGKEIKLTPEEAVRQLYLMVLIQDFSYPVKRIAIEYGVTFGRETKRADICIFDKDRPTVPYILVELKKPKLKDGKDQLKSYCNATGAPIGVWTNGDSISWYQRKDPNYFEDIPRIPTALEKLSDVLSERWTIDDLVKYDKLVNEKKSLKDLILEMEDEVLANAGVDVFEELFKLIFTKLYDEMEGGRDKKRHLVFKNYGDTETELKTKIQELFDKAREKWDGVFTDDAKLQLTPSHLAVCVSSLEGVKLFNSNLDVVDEAFEYLINKSSKGEKGQYFTPRYVIDMCVKMLNPREHETLIDTAAGSCGFPVHGIFHVWEQIMQQEGLSKSHLFTTEKKPARCETYVQDKVFAIDFDEKAVRVGRTLNLIAGDGQTNVLHLNTLDYERWDEKTKDEDWGDIYGEGWKKLRKLRVNKDSNRDFGFDVLMANPPFAGDIKETRILAKYELGKKDNGKYQTTVGRDILFIERNLNFLKPGGRMAVVLPQGRFNNSSDKQIRQYIAENARILAVVGLHGNVFKPHTGTKTSVLLVQKWDDVLCPKVDDYPIFFATMQEPSKDNSGDKIYVKQQKVSTFEANDNQDGFKLVKYEQADFLKKYGSIKEATIYEFQRDGKKTRMNLEQIESRFGGLAFVENPANLIAPTESNELLMDAHGHLIVKHDLFNHDGLTQDGITEAFIEFAKKENLSFFDSVKQDLNNYSLHTLNTSEKSFKDSFTASGRLDAEYYHPKFDELEAKIAKTYKLARLKDFLTLNQRGTQPNYAEQGLPVINSKHVREGEVLLTDSRFATLSDKEEPLIIKTGDVLINGTGVGTIGRAACYLHEQNALPDNHVTILRTDSINPIFLSVYLNSIAGKYQVDKYFKGSSGQIELYPKDIDNFYIPLINEETQNQIAELVQQSFTLKAESERLLATAKRAVEIAIETDEQTAMAYINEKTGVQT